MKNKDNLIKEKIRLMRDMITFAYVRNDGWIPDWRNRHEVKWGIQSDYGNDFSIKAYYSHNANVFGITLKNEKDAEDMYKTFIDRLKKYYNKQY